MSKGLEQYKAFIDGLAERKDAVEAAWIRETGYSYDHFDSMHFDFICRCEGNEWSE